MISLSLTRRSGALPQQPTTAAPGSEAKVQVLIERASRREALFHPDDATIAQATPVITAAHNPADNCPTCIVPADTGTGAPEGTLLDSDLEWAS